MCGIVGYIGKKEKTLEVLINGLSSLEYRGYDSAGIAYKKGNDIEIIKSVGRISNLKEKINFKEQTNLGIGHTRWATHGGVNEENSHPHNVGNITLVHNGIIENYAELKEELIRQGYQFKSQTDTEVACALIDSIYKEEKDILKSINKAIKKIEGSYAFGILVNNDDNLYIAKNNSPLIIGLGDDEKYIASDVPAILEYTNKYYTLNEKEYAVINVKEVTVYNEEGNVVTKEERIFDGDATASQKNGYEHFMLKEMNEQSDIFKKTINEYFNNNFEKLPDITKYNKIDIVACGSAYHAGMVGKALLEEYTNTEVNVHIASEYRYKKLFIDEKTLVILISQSGETADTLAALKIAKEHNSDTLAIVNVKDSSIARAADYVIYTLAGPEIAVATTKAYSAQVLTLILLSIKTAIIKNLLTDEEIKQIKEDIKIIPQKIEELLHKDYTELAKIIYKQNDIYYLGRRIDYALALEGSLKLKEISYIHSEAYAAGELKHGTISLIENDTPVITLLTDENIASKTISNMKETKARGSFTITIKLNDIDVESDYNIDVPVVNKMLQPILAVIPLQMLSYEVAKLRECDIDKPKNLAKSVTVE